MRYSVEIETRWADAFDRTFLETRWVEIENASNAQDAINAAIDRVWNGSVNRARAMSVRIHHAEN